MRNDRLDEFSIFTEKAYRLCDAVLQFTQKRLSAVHLRALETLRGTVVFGYQLFEKSPRLHIIVACIDLFYSAIYSCYHFRWRR
jgi:hypothetical protein